MIGLELNYTELGQRIAKRRKQNNIRQNALADILNISNNYLSSIERGKERPSLEILVRICNALQVTPDYLLMGNMHSNNIPTDIVEGLRLCSEDDLLLISGMVRMMIDRNGVKWNDDNFA